MGSALVIILWIEKGEEVVVVSIPSKHGFNSASYVSHDPQHRVVGTSQMS